ncbi:hypothetical protein [Microbacterium karelineae]|uniref:hypothetical protein n=1 Tax=Microbacterium karelineae TaxID=2654283 RepID=UPI0012EA24B5|nr:hypothetical protein [Microbacterium karelineae]
MTTDALAIDALSIRPSPIALLRRTEAGIRFDHAISSGRLHRIRSGVYVDAAEWERTPPWDRDVARIHAFALKSPGTVFVLESAAALYTLPVLGKPRHLHARAATASGARLTRDVQWHHTSDEPDVTEAPGIAATSPIDTIVDLARTRHPAIARAAADALIRKTRINVATLLSANDARISGRGRSAARWPLSTATGRVETPLESVSLCVIEWLGFEPPELQVEFALPDGSIARADCYWPSVDVIGEADGREKYSLDGSIPEDRMWSEKRREDALRRQARGVARWTWDDLRHPETMRQILRTAGVPEVAPTRSELLRTLRPLI